MNHTIRYDCYNIENSVFSFSPAIRNGTTFKIFDCTVKFHRTVEEEIIFWVDNRYSKVEAKYIIDKTTKILSYVFMAPLYRKDVLPSETKQHIECNNLLGKKKTTIFTFLESNINKFDKTSAFFYEVLDLLNVAIDNIYKERSEDAFVYFFKVVERIAKQYYILYLQRYHTKALIKYNKKEMKNFIERYSLNNLHVKLTEDMLNNTVDLFYKDLKKNLYGSTYNKISLFITKNNININVDLISKLVKLRNKIAHGDPVSGEELNNSLFECKELALEMFSKHFFRKSYKELYIEPHIYVV